ncbi:MAG: AMP-binding enzyme, partial [Steroidobacteraceae bacterium]
VFAYVICRGSKPTGEEAVRLAEELRAWVSEQLGAIAKPDEIRLTEVLPKTRSGKIMRRLLRAVARGEEVSQDVSTLENPAILDQLRGIERSPRKAAPGAIASRRRRVATKRRKTTRAAKTKRTAKAKSAAKSQKAPKAKKTAKATKRGRRAAKTAVVRSVAKARGRSGARKSRR